MLTAIHRFGRLSYGKPCGSVAFWYDEEGADPKSMQAERVTLPGGASPEMGQTMRCGTCGMEIGLDALDLIPGEWNARVK